MRSCSHQIQLQNDKIDKMQKDFAYRLCTLSAQQLGAGDSDELRRGRHRIGRHARHGAAALFADAPRRSAAAHRRRPTIDASGNSGGFNAAPAHRSDLSRGRPPGTLGTLRGRARAAERLAGVRRPARPNTTRP